MAEALTWEEMFALRSLIKRRKAECFELMEGFKPDSTARRLYIKELKSLASMEKKLKGMM